MTACPLCHQSRPSRSHHAMTTLLSVVMGALLLIAGLYTGRLWERYSRLESQVAMQQRLLDGWSQVVVFGKRHPVRP